ncbi:MAG TPA: hypothetical protein DDW52_02575 [Planctomycetaceae bacterium]|nr:hypothetical protein [Planctomycetaceae bacterium]
MKSLPRQLAGSLCIGCEHHRRIVSGTGSVFLLCSAGVEHPHLPKYPRQPVASCAVFTPLTAPKTDRESSSAKPTGSGKSDPNDHS